MLSNIHNIQASHGHQSYPVPYISSTKFENSRLRGWGERRSDQRLRQRQKKIELGRHERNVLIGSRSGLPSVMLRACGRRG